MNVEHIVSRFTHHPSRLLRITLYALRFFKCVNFPIAFK